ncbi:hypothetical protein JCM1393_00940 [Clostridium carnis]
MQTYEINTYNFKNLITKVAFTPNSYINIDELNLIIKNSKSFIANKKNNSYKDLYLANFLIGICNLSLKNLKTAINNFTTCLNIAKNLNKDYLLGCTYTMLSISYIEIENFSKHNKYFNLAEEILHINKYNEELLYLYVKTIILRFKFYDAKKNISYYMEKALNLLSETQCEYSAQAYMELGFIYSTYLSSDSYSIELFTNGLNLARKYNQSNIEVMLLYYIGTRHFGLSQNSQALITFNNLLKDYKENLSTTMKLLIFIEIIEIYLEDKENLSYVNNLINNIESEISTLLTSDKESFIAKILLLKARLNLITKNEDFSYTLKQLISANTLYLKNLTCFKFTHFDYWLEMTFGNLYYEMEEYKTSLLRHKGALDCANKYEIKYRVNSYTKISNDYEALGDYKNAYFNMKNANNLLNYVEHRDLIDEYTKIYNDFQQLKDHDKDKNDFFTNLSHELKTPINFINSSIQLLNSFKNSDCSNFKNHYLKYEKSITKNCLRMLKLVDNLIDITKIDSGSAQLSVVNLDIVSFVESLIDSVIPFVKSKNLNIVFDTEIEQIYTDIDLLALERIILNLLSNAIKFTNSNGNITISIYTKNKTINITIKDDGIGIPIDFHKHIFERFSKVDKSLSREKEGSGLGLYLASSLVKMHNGSISINSEYTDGCEFIVTLPIINSGLYSLQNTDNFPINDQRILAELSDIYELF